MESPLRITKIIDLIGYRTIRMLELDTIMATELITIGVDDYLNSAREIMRDWKIRHLPVVDTDGQLVGLITTTNVMAATDSFLRDDESRVRLKDIPVKEAMVADVITVDEHAGIRQAALFMEKHRIGCLPVMSAGKLCGIVTDADFVGVAINLLEQLENAEGSETEYDDVAYQV